MTLKAGEISELERVIVDSTVRGSNRTCKSDSVEPRGQCCAVGGKRRECREEIVDVNPHDCSTRASFRALLSNWSASAGVRSSCAGSYRGEVHCREMAG